MFDVSLQDLLEDKKLAFIKDEAEIIKNKLINYFNNKNILSAPYSVVVWILENHDLTESASNALIQNPKTLKSFLSEIFEQKILSDELQEVILQISPNAPDLAKHPSINEKSAKALLDQDYWVLSNLTKNKNISREIRQQALYNINKLPEDIKELLEQKGYFNHTVDFDKNEEEKEEDYIF